MTYPLINTKFGIPSSRPVLVRRRRLFERLEAGSHARLTLISAPAGSGKTTLAAEWLRSVRQPVSWLSLDEADNDPARFLNYLLAALQIIDERAGAETRALLQAPQAPSPNLLGTTLLNEISRISQDFILALDDYHVIQTLPIQELLNLIVEHQPAQMRLVLITREDPPLPLPRLRARGQVCELRQEDLRFTEAESAEFLGTVMGLKLSAGDIAALERRTEGWITGLQLAALSMQGRDDAAHFVRQFTGSNRYVLDYLAQEVFERQPGETQDFILKVSILERFCASLCEAVTGRSACQELLEDLERANLFIMPLEQSRTWYRYHRLFRDLLRGRLPAQDQAALRALHRRAGEWFEAHEMHSEAIQHALSGADWEKALKLLRAANTELTKRGEVFTLLNWYSQLPEDVILSDPQYCLDYSWVLMLAGQFERAGNYLAQAEAGAGDEPAFLGQVYTARAHLARVRGDHQAMVTLSHKALAMLPKEDADARSLVSTNLGIAYWHSGNMQAAEEAMREAYESGTATGNHYTVATALVFQGMAMAVRGKLHAAYERFQSVVRGSGTPPFILGLTYLYLGVLDYEWNDLAHSGEHLLQAMQIAERIHNDEVFVAVNMMMARLHTASGNLAAAGDLLEATHRRILEGEVSTPIVPRLAAARVQYALACNDLEAASSWAGRLGEGDDWHTFHRFTNTTRALYLLALGQNERAAGHLETCFRQASQAGWEYGKIAIRSLQALAAPETHAALDYLEDALDWAQPEGYLRTFVDLGSRLEPVLQAAQRRGIAPAYTEKILAALKTGAPKPVLGQLSLVEPLSRRELDVLRLLAAGLTNRQIATELVISTGTAKTHVHNICGKLGADNRTGAAARARELGLV